MALSSVALLATNELPDMALPLPDTVSTTDDLHLALVDCSLLGLA